MMYILTNETIKTISNLKQVRNDLKTTTNHFVGWKSHHNEVYWLVSVSLLSGPIQLLVILFQTN